MLFYWLLSSALRAQPGRWLIAGLAVALGIALAVAIHTVNRSALSEFSRALDLVNGQASAQIIMPTGEFSDQLYDQIVTYQTELGIRAISPVLERNTAQIRVLGIDIFQAGRVSPSLMPFVSEINSNNSFQKTPSFYRPLPCKSYNYQLATSLRSITKARLFDSRLLVLCRVQLAKRLL